MTKARHWLDSIAIFGLVAFALFSLLKTAPPHYGLALALPAALAGVWQRRQPPYAPTTWLTLALAAWLIIRYALQPMAGLVEPGLYGQREVFIDWLFVLIFALMGAIEAPVPLRRVGWLWLLAGTGFLIGILTYLWGTGFDALWSGRRLRYHLDRPLGVGLYAGCLAIALLGTIHLWWHTRTPWRWPVRAGGLLIAALLIQVVVTTQNRSNLIGFALVLIMGLGVLAVRAWRQRQHTDGRKLMWVVMLGAAISAGAIAANWSSVSKRFEREAVSITTAMESGLDNAAATSATVRLQLWRYVAVRFADAPLIGHGFGDLRDVIDRDLRAGGGLIESERYDHVHNSYLQALWTQGLIGVALWGALCFALVRQVHRNAKRDAAVRRLLAPMWGILIYTGVWAAFDYRLSHPDMRFFTILCLLSLLLMGRARTTPAGLS